MAFYTLKRVLVAIPVLLFVALGTFALVYLMPGDSATAVAGEGADEKRIAEVREQLGLNDSFLDQFGRWVGGISQGDFGTSIVHHRPVLDIIVERVGVTLSIVVVGFILAALIGIPAGIAAGIRAGSPLDRVITALTTAGIAIPAFWLGMLLVIVFAISLGWFRATGYTSLFDDPLRWAQSMVLPGLAVAAASAADVARQTRASVADAIAKDFTRTNIAMGFFRQSVVYRHALRNAGIPIVAVLGVQIERLFSAAVVIEIVFAMPGIGTFLVNSAQSQDLPVIQGIVLMIAVAIITTNLLVDLTYSWINPRIRTQ